MEATVGRTLKELERFWEPGSGVFWRLRQGEFVAADVEQFLVWLRRVQVDDEALLPRRLVSLLWYIPTFLCWQTDRVREAGGDVRAYEKASAAILNEVERILGVP